MNSLSELNNYNNTLTYSYTDNRVTGLTFDRLTPTNQTLTVNEGSSFTHPVGLDVLEIINYETSLPTLTINISSPAGLTINWPVTPAGVTITEISPGVWRASGWTNKITWDQIKAPTITCPQSIPNAYFGTFTYTATIGYLDGALGPTTKSYTVTVSVQDVTFMTTPVTLTYDPSSTTNITNPPQIINIDATYPGATFTVVGTPSPSDSISNFNSTGVGGTFNYNAGNKTFTITGTRSQVNTRLSTLTVTSNTNTNDFILSYVLSNNQDSTQDTKNQQFRNTSIQYLTNASPISMFYIEDNASNTLITGNPIITDADYDGTGTYTVEIYPTSTSYITDMSATSTGAGGTATFNNATKKLTIVGNRAQCNDYLANLYFRPGEDTVIQFQMNYKLTLPSPRTNVVLKTQNFVCNQSHDETSNLTVTRNYIGNNANLIFSTNTPQIIDLDSIGTNTYTVTLTCSFGKFSIIYNQNPLVQTALSSPFTITGTKAEINSALALIRFYPNAGVSSNGTFTYTQSKNGNLQVSAICQLNGTPGTHTLSTTKLVFTSTTTWTPTYEQVMYADVYNLSVVGAGGGGAGNTGSGNFGGSGGGGGGALYRIPGPFSLSPNTTYSFNIGVGGAGGAVNATYDNAKGKPGGSTSAFGYTAPGGGGGGDNPDQDLRRGGRSGTTNQLGGTGYVNGLYGNYGGGGAGGPEPPPGYPFAWTSRYNADFNSTGQGGISAWEYYYDPITGTVGGPTATLLGQGGGGGGNSQASNQDGAGAREGGGGGGNGATQSVPATTMGRFYGTQAQIPPPNPYDYAYEQSKIGLAVEQNNTAYGKGGGGGGGYNTFAGAQGNGGRVEFYFKAK